MAKCHQFGAAAATRRIRHISATFSEKTAATGAASGGMSSNSNSKSNSNSGEDETYFYSIKMLLKCVKTAQKYRARKELACFAVNVADGLYGRSVSRTVSSIAVYWELVSGIF
jgi:hypothetical protein